MLFTDDNRQREETETHTGSGPVCTVVWTPRQCSCQPMVHKRRRWTDSRLGLMFLRPSSVSSSYRSASPRSPKSAHHQPQHNSSSSKRLW